MMIGKAYAGTQEIFSEWEKVNPLTVNDLRYFPYGLDSHCTGVLRILFKKPEVQSLVRDYDHLDWIVWNHDSGLNFKKTLMTGEPFVGEDVTPNDPQIWDQIKVEYHNLQYWWLEKKV